MKNIHITDSYKIWSKKDMEFIIVLECYKKYNTVYADWTLNRSYAGMYVEWWLHNIGYYLTKPFPQLNERLKHVDLEEHIK